MIDLLKIFKVKELEEFKFKGVANYTYRVKDNTLQFRHYCEDWVNSEHSLNTIVKTEIELLPYKPECDDRYYYPSFRVDCGYGIDNWVNSQIDKNIAQRVGVYRTSEEAINKAKELGWI